MKSHQFPTFDAAIAYLKERGKLEYHGRIGHDSELCLYTFTQEGKKYEVRINYDTGKMEVRE
jgi:hypothetical protein